MNRVLTVFALICVTIALHAESVTLRIAAEPEALLLALGPSLRIWITNHGSVNVEVPTKVALQVTSPRGEPFVAYSAPRADEFTMTLDTEQPFIVKPGETRDVSFWIRDDWFGVERRFGAPGVFRLQLIADSGLDSAKLAGVNRVVEQPGLTNPLVSNETSLTVIEPTGADLLVWNMAKEKGMCSPAVTEFIWTQHPDSSYAAFCVRDMNDPDPMKEIAGFEEALALAPPRARAETYRINIARAWKSRGSSLTEEDVDAAFEAYEKARVILERLAKSAIVPDHKREAARILREEVLDHDQIVREYKRARGEHDGKIETGADCVQKLPDGRNRVWFGYQNSNRRPIEIPIGNDNKFTPPPFDRKQPTTFESDIVHFAFSIDTKEPVLVWHFQGKATTYKIKDQMACPPGIDPKDPTTWATE